MIAAELTQRRITERAALIGSSNFEKKEDKEQALTSLEESYEDALMRLYDPKAEDDTKIDWDDPFHAASKRAQEKMGLRSPELPEGAGVAALERQNAIADAVADVDQI